MTRPLWILAVALVAGPLAAQEAPPPRPLEFTGDIGFVNTAGNTDVTTLNVGEKITNNRGKLTLKQFFALVYARTDGQTTNSLWRTGVRGDYALSPTIAVFGSGTFDRNRFAGISRRFEEGVGIAVKLLNREQDKLAVEAGLAMTQQRSTLDVEDNFTSARTAALFQHNFNPTAYFLQTVEVLPNLEVSDDLRINTETALVAPLSRRLAIKVSYVVRYDNLPEPTFKKTDRLLTSGLQVTL
jgi:putative salt-induced outer membrane protein